MKKKLALLMAAIMTVAMVPMTAFAAAKVDITAVDTISAAVDGEFNSRVELSKDEDGANLTPIEKTYNGAKYKVFEVRVTLENATFTKNTDLNGDEYYVMTDVYGGDGYIDKSRCSGVWEIDVRDDNYAVVTLNADRFNTPTNPCILDILAKTEEAGVVTAKFSSNNSVFGAVTEEIATAYDGDVVIESDGVVTFVEDSKDDVKKMKPITITGLYNGALKQGTEITLKLKGNFKFNVKEYSSAGHKGEYFLVDPDGNGINIENVVSFLNDPDAGVKFDYGYVTDDEITLKINEHLNEKQVADMYINGIYLTPTSKCDPGDVATLTISSKEFDSNKIEVAKMVEEAVTYTVEDDDLPVIWAGKDYLHSDEDNNTLEVSVEENTGDILNTSRKATFTFPEGIEVVNIDYSEKDFEPNFKYKIDENVVTIWDYSKNVKATAKESEKPTDFGINFLLNAAPTFSGDVDVTLGGEFDDVELTVATVKAPYTVEAKTSEVLIDYRYVPVNEIVITEAEEGILEEDDTVILEVEKMDFEDAGSYEVTSGDIDVDVDIYGDDKAYLVVTVKDESTEASSITISGLELYLDRTLPVGGYALENIGSWGTDLTTGEHLYNKDRANQANNILWENSSTDKDLYSYDAVEGERGAKAPNYKAIFEYDAVVCNDSYVEVVTAGRDQDDSSTTRKIVITIGATTMAVGTETVTLDTPAYINAENYTELPLRAVSEAFGATVGWDDASRTVTIMMGQRIVSMTIGSKTMYINGTPVAMNTAPEITNERTFVPVRDLANALGITKIDWNEASATVTLN